MSRAYGDAIGECFGAARSSLIVRSAALDNHVAATYLHCTGAGTGLTDPIPPEPSLLLAIQIGPLTEHELWIDGRKMPAPPYHAGAVTMLDLQCRPMANLVSAYECVQNHFPRSALDQISDVEQTPRLGDIPLLLGEQDPALAAFGQLAAAAVSPVGPGSSLFLESLLLLGAHRYVRQRYAGMRAPVPARKAARLSPRHESYVKGYMEAHLDGNISLLTLAAMCGLSTSHFSRAFKAVAGLSPHRWLMERRLARARHLMVTQALSLAEVALACGFHDQSHFSREFRRAEGAPPAAWKRANGISRPAPD